MAAKMQETPETTQQLFALMEVVEEARRITYRRLVEQVDEMTQRLQVNAI